jgi:hypothetical protein
MSHDVFVSYSRKNQQVAVAARAAMERRGLRVWMDKNSLSGGADWAGEIVKALETSKVMVVVFSARANASDNVRREVQCAVNKGLTLIPFRIENVEPTRALELFLSSPHWIDAYPGPLDEHLDRLCGAVRTALDARRAASRPSIPIGGQQAPVARPLAEPIGTSSAPWPRNIAFGVAGGVVLGALVGLLLYNSPGDSSNGAGVKDEAHDNSRSPRNTSNGGVKAVEYKRNCYETTEDCSGFNNEAPIKGSLAFDSGALKIGGVSLEIEGASSASAVWLRRLVEKIEKSKTTVRCVKNYSGKYNCFTTDTNENVSDILTSIVASKR